MRTAHEAKIAVFHYFRTVRLPEVINANPTASYELRITAVDIAEYSGSLNNIAYKLNYVFRDNLAVSRICPLRHFILELDEFAFHCRRNSIAGPKMINEIMELYLNSYSTELRHILNLLMK